MLILAALALAICPPEGKRVSCIVDGDTFWLAGEKIRVADDDTPEIEHAQCAAEKARGERAMRRLQELLSSGEVTIQRQGRDRYGRTLAVVSVNGRNVARTLISEGLAHPWDGRRHPWC